MKHGFLVGPCFICLATIPHACLLTSRDTTYIHPSDPARPSRLILYFMIEMNIVRPLLLYCFGAWLLLARTHAGVGWWCW